MQQDPTKAARRAAILLRRAAAALGAVLVAMTAFTAIAPSAAAAGPKVVIVVGPASSSTSAYLTEARGYAAEATSLGASVTEVFTPHATWSRVRSAVQGAQVLIYLGHGYGWPSPYTSSFTPSHQDGLGLNPVDGKGATTPVTYVGESTFGANVRLAPGAIVLLNHLCYASGTGESGMANPSWSVARQRVDNYAAGFIHAGAKAVVADAHDVSYELRIALSTGTNFLDAWRASPMAQGHERDFASTRHPTSPGWTNYIDPDGTSSGFYRSLTTQPGFTTGSSLAAAPMVRSLTAAVRTRTAVRATRSATSRAVAIIAAGAHVTVTGALRADAWGRTWVPVRTSAGKTGWVAAWLLNLSGSAVPVTTVVLRARPTTSATKLTTVPVGSRVSVSHSLADSRHRVWLSVRTASGQAGWVAAWYMEP